MASPIKLSHIVLQTNKPRELREWYCQVLGAEIVHENEFISFISYDDEHHRVAFLNPGALEPRQPDCRSAVLRDRRPLRRVPGRPGVVPVEFQSDPGFPRLERGCAEAVVAPPAVASEQANRHKG